MTIVVTMKLYICVHIKKGFPDLYYSQKSPVGWEQTHHGHQLLDNNAAVLADILLALY